MHINDKYENIKNSFRKRWTNALLSSIITYVKQLLEKFLLADDKRYRYSL